MTDDFYDLELKAMQEIIKILETLDEVARERVIDYVLQRLGISMETNLTHTTLQPAEFTDLKKRLQSEDNINYLDIFPSENLNDFSINGAISLLTTTDNSENINDILSELS